MRIETEREDRNISKGISRRQFIKLTGTAVAGLLVGCVSERAVEPVLALTNGTLIDGTGARARPDAVVLIQSGRILSAGVRAQIEIPAHAKLIDVQGGTILPGFINAHVHAAYNEVMLKTWAIDGVTTVRDLGAYSPYMDELFIRRDALCAIPTCARLVAVGSFINVAGGYPVAFWGGHVVAVSTPKDAQQAVNRLVDAGADVIKTAMESGYAFGKSGWPLLAPETATALVDAAHARGKPVTAHVTSARDLTRALDAGVDEIAHMVVDELPEAIVLRMVAAGTRWVPTLELWQGVGREYSVDYGKTAIRNLAMFVAAGGEVVLGTDYAGAPNVHFDLGMPICEIGLMQEAGMTPMQIVVAATQNGARACNMENTLGTLEAGKQADVLVVDGNPLVDIQAFAQKRLVLREGKSVFPSSGGRHDNRAVVDRLVT